MTQDNLPEKIGNYEPILPPKPDMPLRYLPEETLRSIDKDIAEIDAECSSPTFEADARVHNPDWTTPSIGPSAPNDTRHLQDAYFKDIRNLLLRLKEQGAVYIDDDRQLKIFRAPSPYRLDPNGLHPFH